MYDIRLPIADFIQWSQLDDYYYTLHFVYTVGILRENIFVKTLIFKYCWRRYLLQVDERIIKVAYYINKNGYINLVKKKI